MKLACIYNVWDGCELLEKSIDQIYDHTDLIIIVYQTLSNYGEHYNPLPELKQLEQKEKVTFLNYEPDLGMTAMMNERIKRNAGLELAKANHCTHFLHMDTDEFYADFKGCKELYLKLGHAGSVCKMQTYFKKPTLKFDRPEDYFVPFIHELRPDTVTGSSSYPYYVDPTRTVNERDIIELPIFMHHFSWVRKDIMRKARNSSANLMDKRVENNNQIWEAYNDHNLGAGYHMKNWNRTLIEVEDIFGLSDLF